MATALYPFRVLLKAPAYPRSSVTASGTRTFSRSLPPASSLKSKPLPTQDRPEEQRRPLVLQAEREGRRFRLRTCSACP